MPQDLNIPLRLLALPGGVVLFLAIIIFACLVEGDRAAQAIIAALVGALGG